ncbi:hypothetical protein N9975_00350 [bacterium]|nr:hypothetical protein [bacterium]
MSKNRPNSSDDKQEDTVAADFNGAAIIDEQGVEVPITEDMVQTACDELGDY